MEEANAFFEPSKMPLSFFTSSGLLDVKTAQKYRVSKTTSLPPASCEAAEQPHPSSFCSSRQGQRSEALSARLPIQGRPARSSCGLHGSGAPYASPRL